MEGYCDRLGQARQCGSAEAECHPFRQELVCYSACVHATWAQGLHSDDFEVDASMLLDVWAGGSADQAWSAAVAPARVDQNWNAAVMALLRSMGLNIVISFWFGFSRGVARETGTHNSIQ